MCNYINYRYVSLPIMDNNKSTVRRFMCSFNNIMFMSVLGIQLAGQAMIDGFPYSYIEEYITCTAIVKQGSTCAISSSWIN